MPEPQRFETVWTQCLMELIKRNSLRRIDTISLKEVDRMAALVAQEIRIDASRHIMKVVSDTANGFDEEIPF